MNFFRSILRLFYSPEAKRREIVYRINNILLRDELEGYKHFMRSAKHSEA